MAKQIKAIKCPHCGSVKATQLSPDYYQCESCSTRFFLDNDDININIRDTSAPKPQLEPKKALYIVGGVFAFFLLFGLLSSLFKSSTPRYAGSGSAVERSENWWHEKRVFFEASDKTPVILKAGSLTESGGKSKGMAALYNAQTGKEIKRIDLGTDKFDDAEYRVFDDGTPYLIVNDAKLFKIDRAAKNLVEVKPPDFGSQPDLQTGWAKMEFVYDNYGSGFNIMTNDGKQVFYYPIPNRLYTGMSSPHDAAQEPVPENATQTATGFAFTSKSSDFKDEKLQLIRYKYTLAPGYPRREPSFSWTKDRLADIHNPPKTLISKHSLEGGKVLSYEDLTPGRLYFEPKLLGFNDKYVVIAFQATPAEDAPLQLQMLNAANGQVVWTLPAPVPEHAPVGVYAYNAWLSDKGTFIEANYYGLFVGPDGKIIQKLD